MFYVGALIPGESAYRNAQIVIGAPAIGPGACSSAANKHPVVENR